MDEDLYDEDFEKGDIVENVSLFLTSSEVKYMKVALDDFERVLNKKSSNLDRMVFGGLVSKHVSNEIFDRFVFVKATSNVFQKFNYQSLLDKQANYRSVLKFLGYVQSKSGCSNQYLEGASRSLNTMFQAISEK